MGVGFMELGSSLVMYKGGGHRLQGGQEEQAPHRGSNRLLRFQCPRSLRTLLSLTYNVLSSPPMHARRFALRFFLRGC